MLSCRLITCQEMHSPPRGTPFKYSYQSYDNWFVVDGTDRWVNFYRVHSYDDEGLQWLKDNEYNGRYQTQTQGLLGSAGYKSAPASPAST